MYRASNKKNRRDKSAATGLLPVVMGGVIIALLALLVGILLFGGDEGSSSSASRAIEAWYARQFNNPYLMNSLGEDECGERVALMQRLEEACESTLPRESRNIPLIEEFIDRTTGRLRPETLCLTHMIMGDGGPTPPDWDGEVSELRYPSVTIRSVQAGPDGFLLYENNAAFYQLPEEMRMLDIYANALRLNGAVGLTHYDLTIEVIRGDGGEARVMTLYGDDEEHSINMNDIDEKELVFRATTGSTHRFTLDRRYLSVFTHFVPSTPGSFEFSITLAHSETTRSPVQICRGACRACACYEDEAGNGYIQYIPEASSNCLLGSPVFVYSRTPNGTRLLSPHFDEIRQNFTSETERSLLSRPLALFEAGAAISSTRGERASAIGGSANGPLISANVIASVNITSTWVDEHGVLHYECTPNIVFCCGESRIYFHLCNATTSSWGYQISWGDEALYSEFPADDVLPGNVKREYVSVTLDIRHPVGKETMGSIEGMTLLYFPEKKSFYPGNRTVKTGKQEYALIGMWKKDENATVDTTNLHLVISMVKLEQ